MDLGVKRMKCNYHTHTKRCNHAQGSDEEYVLSAIENGYEVLGFADHTPWKYNSNYTPRIRMRLEEFENYYASLKALKEKYKDKIEILIGVEAEYFPEYMEWFKEFKEKNLDYAIFGNHFYISDEKELYFGRLTDKDEYLEAYVDYCIKGLSTGIYSYLCHPDLFMRGRQVFDEKALWASETICEYASEHNIPLEYNLEGLHITMSGRNVYYPYDEFWKVAKKYNCKAIIGVDAHNPDSLKDDTYRQKALNFLNNLGIEVIDKIL